MKKEKFIELLNPNLSKTLDKISLSGPVSKISDKYTQSDVFSLSKSGKLAMPRSPRQHLSMTNPFITIQIFIPSSKSFILDLSLLDSSYTKRKLTFANCIKIYKDPIHTKLPAAFFPKDSWCNLCIDLATLCSCYFSHTFNEIEAISIGGVCKIRRIFMSISPLDTEELPNCYKLPGKFLMFVVAPSSFEETAEILEAKCRVFEENARKENKVSKPKIEKRYCLVDNMSFRPNLQSQNVKSVNFTNRKKNLLKPIEKIGSLYENMINSLSEIRYSTPPFVHTKQEALFYDPISKSYIS